MPIRLYTEEWPGQVGLDRLVDQNDTPTNSHDCQFHSIKQACVTQPWSMCTHRAQINKPECQPIYMECSS